MTNPAPAAALTEQDQSMMHRAGLGTYRPMGDKPIARANALVAAGMLGLNAKTGIYFLTLRGADALH